nr:isoform 2 of methylsterol monooxygenase 2-2 [Quercus suber]
MTLGSNDDEVSTEVRRRSLQHCTKALGCGRQSGGSRGGRRRGGDRAGRGRTTEPDPISDEGDDLGVEESWLGTNWVLFDDGGRTLQCTPDAGIGPSYTAGHEGTFPTQTMSCGASTDYEDPPHMSPPVFSGSAHDGGCIFVPTPGMPIPPLVHVEPTMATSSPTPHEDAIQIEQISVEDIEPVEGLWRSRHPPTHAPNCGTGDALQCYSSSDQIHALTMTKNNSPAAQEKCITRLLLYHFGVNLPVMLLSYPIFKFMGMRSSLPLLSWYSQEYSFYADYVLLRP